MFGDMAIVTIVVSLNISMLLLMVFMWYVSRLSGERNRQEGTVHEEQAYRRS